jgi:hypothetical protein
LVSIKVALYACINVARGRVKSAETPQCFLSTKRRTNTRSKVSSGQRRVSFEGVDRKVSLDALKMNSGIGGVTVRLTGEELLDRRESKLVALLVVYELSDVRA